MTRHSSRDRRWSPLAAVGVLQPKRPLVDVALAPAVGAWGLRVALALAGMACAAVASANVGQGVFAGAVALAMACWPSVATTSTFVGTIGLLVLTAGAEAFEPRLFVLVFMLHVTVELAGVVNELPWAARVERRVLTALAGPWLVAQLVAQLAAAAASWMVAGSFSLPWLLVLAAVGLVVLSVTVLVRLLPGAG